MKTTLPKTKKRKSAGQMASLRSGTLVRLSVQRLRSLTTGRLHTTMDDIYRDLETLTGEKGIMTHMIPNVMRALEPWLREKITDARFWNGEHDPAHTGNVEIQTMNGGEQVLFFARYQNLPNPLAGKSVIAVHA